MQTMHGDVNEYTYIYIYICNCISIAINIILSTHIIIPHDNSILIYIYICANHVLFHVISYPIKSKSHHVIHIWLVVYPPTPLKNMKVSWDGELPNRWKNNIPVPNDQPTIHGHFP